MLKCSASCGDRNSGTPSTLKVIRNDVVSPSSSVADSVYVVCGVTAVGTPTMVPPWAATSWGRR